MATPASAPRNDPATLPTVPTVSSVFARCASASRAALRSIAPWNGSRQARHAGLVCGLSASQKTQRTTTHGWQAAHCVAPHTLSLWHAGQGMAFAAASALTAWRQNAHETRPGVTGAPQFEQEASIAAS